MKIVNFMNQASCMTNVTVSSRQELFGAMLEAVCQPGGDTRVENLDRESVVDALEAREQLHTTALGHGIAFPHARLPELKPPGSLLPCFIRPCFSGSSRARSFA